MSLPAGRQTGTFKVLRSTTEFPPTGAFVYFTRGDRSDPDVDIVEAVDGARETVPANRLSVEAGPVGHYTLLRDGMPWLRVERLRGERVTEFKAPALYRWAVRALRLRNRWPVMPTEVSLEFLLE